MNETNRTKRGVPIVKTKTARQTGAASVSRRIKHLQTILVVIVCAVSVSLFAVLSGCVPAATNNAASEVPANTQPAPNSVADNPQNYNSGNSANANTGNNGTGAPSANTGNNNVNQNNNGQNPYDMTYPYSLDQAKQIAADHAQIAIGELTFTKARLDYDDGIAEYEIEFVYGTTEYEYEIDATTGTMTSIDIDSIYD